MSQSSKTRRNASPDLLYNHLPPHAPEMERSVLGALMVDGSGFDEVTELLSPDSFYDKKNQLIYDAIQELAAKEQPFDALAVKDRLEKNGKFEEAGGMAYLGELMREATGSAGIRYHAEVINEKYIRRRIIASTSEAQTNAFDDTFDSKELLDTTQASLYAISEQSQRKEYTQIDPVVRAAYKEVQDAANNKGGMSGIPALFSKLDKKTSGWQKSDLIIIGARPAMGKTAFALSMARNIAFTQNKPMAFFSLEMSAIQLTKRLMSNVCEIPADKLRSGQLEPYEWAQLDSGLGEMMGKNLIIDDTSALSIFELRTKARRMKEKENIELIMIDYLQLMNASGMKFSSRQEEVSLISRNLKALAKELDIPIIALSQVSRKVSDREGEDAKRPQLSDLRESGSIEQDADLVCFIHRPEYYHITGSSDGQQDYRGKAEIIIAKHRNGETGIVYLKFKPEFTRFMDPDDSTISGNAIHGEAMEAVPRDEFPPSPFDDQPFAGATEEVPY